MAIISIPRNEFEKHIKLSKDIEEKISLFGTPLDSVTNEEVNIEVYPNRPDLLSAQGFLRSFLQFIGKSRKKTYEIKKSDARIIVDKSVENIRPYSMAAIVKNVKFSDEKIKEMMQFQEKIHATIGRNRKKVAMGYYILDKISFPVSYTAKNPKDIVFEPLDMPEKMNALQILSRHQCGREYGHLLQNQEKFPVYYDSKGNVLSLPPIINSNDSGKITPGTSDIFIEASGTDQLILNRVLAIAVADLIDCGGTAYSVEIVYKNKKESLSLDPEKIKISLDNINKILGTEITEKQAAKLLEKMQLLYENKTVSYPSWRTDILHEIDIAEDLAIAYGYENFVPAIPDISAIGEEILDNKIANKISEILCGLGLNEISSLHLVNKENIKKMCAKTENIIEVESPKTEYNSLRENLLLNSCRILSENLDSEYPQKIFEIGKIFSRSKDSETGIKESSSLAVSLCPGNFTEIKQICEYLASSLSVKFSYEPKDHSSFIPGRSGKVLLKSREIGIIGEISPQVLKNWHIKMPLSCFEIAIEEIMNEIKK